VRVPARVSLRLAIVEDEAPARARLRRLLAVHSDVQIVLEVDNVDEALAQLPAARADAVFLDIALGEASAFALLDRLPPPWPLLVFATACHQHALRAFEIAALDYLLKPFDHRRLADTLVRLRARLAETGPPAPQTLIAAAEPAHLVVYDRGRRIAVPLASVTHLVSCGNYVELHTEQRHYLMRATLTQLAQSLPAGFLRVHRSHLVREDQIASVTPRAHGDAHLTLRDGSSVLLSRRYRDALPPALRGR
jgi:two-component system LytT family response regulator